MEEITREEILNNVNDDFNTPIDLNDEDIESFVSKGANVLLFSMPDSKPSELQESKLRDIFEEFKAKIDFGIVNVFENQNYAIKNGIKSFPTTVYIKGGEVVDTVTGVQGNMEASFTNIL